MNLSLTFICALAEATFATKKKKTPVSPGKRIIITLLDASPAM
jgi:hypothetical protein